MIDNPGHLDGDGLWAAGRCIGYVGGFADAARSVRNFCPTIETKDGTLVRVYIAYMDKNPKLLDSLESRTLMEALSDAYPCKK